MVRRDEKARYLIPGIVPVKYAQRTFYHIRDVLAYLSLLYPIFAF